MDRAAGMKSLAVRFPRTIRPNAYFREKHPEAVSAVERRAAHKLWSPHQERTPATEEFDVEMLPYLGDPFRGTDERRVLLGEESSLSIQLEAAREALAAARVEPSEIDLTIVTTFYPDQMDTGNAPYLARELGLGGTAVNLETACASSVVGFHTACGLIKAGLYRRALVVIGCRYSHVLAETDPLAWASGDGAGAFVVGEESAGSGFLGHKSEHTAETCGAFFAQLEIDEVAGPRVRMRASAKAGQILRDTSATHLRSCCAGAAQAAGVSMSDIDFFVFNTPTAWFHTFAVRVLGIDPKRTISTNRLYGNTGPVLMPANLFHAALEHRIKKGDLVMLYAVGSVSSASAVVMRWGDVALGAPPPPPLTPGLVPA
jgi:3-oxoacyl-[acyl-carrier-protein] synthase-3